MTSKVSAAITWPLTAASAAQLTVANIEAMTTAQASSLTSADLNAMTAAAFAAMTAAQVKAIVPSAIAGLSATQVKNLTAVEIGAMSTAEIASLSSTALAGLSAAQTAALTAGDLNALATQKLDALHLSGLSTATLQALTTNALAAMTPAELAAALGNNAAALSSTQVGALTGAELNALSASQLQALHMPALSASALGALSAATLANMSAAEFATAVGGNVAALSNAAVAGLSANDIQALSITQLQDFTAAQQAAMSAPAKAAFAAAMLGASGGSTLLGAFAAQEQNGAISYSGLLTVLNDAASGGMTSAKLSALDEIASELNASGGVTTSAYAQQIFDDVVKGNSANATWTGGAATSTALGNLSATSTQTQVDELIGKWFLGTDLPSYQSEGGSYAQGYQTYSEALFANGAPSINDINQGQLGDCYFLSALATEVSQDPTLIENMIQSNGNGAYSVLFHVNGQNDYVTVDTQLVALKSGYVQWDGSTMLYDSNANAMWAPLIEKAYAQLMAQSGVTTYGGVGNIDSYAAIGNGGDSNGLAAITGQRVTEDYIGSGTSAATQQSDLNAVQAAFNAGQGVMLADTSSNGGNFVGDHMYSVVGVNAATDTVTLHNPWGAAACTADGIQATFTATLSQLAQVGSYLEYTTGAQPVA